MANIQETRNLRSNALASNLAHMACEPDKSVRDTEDSSF